MKKNSNKSNIKPWVRWHRRIGIFFALPAIILSVTGVILNHSEFLKLDNLYITNSVILKWYGMEPSDNPKSIAIGSDTVTLIDDLLYLNSKRILEGASMPTGGGQLGEMMLISTEDAVLLLDKDTSALIEKLDNASLPSGKIIASDVQEGRFLIDTTKGKFSATEELVNFELEERKALQGANSVNLSTEMLNDILLDWRGKGLSLWRVILDIHSGKFFGRVGIFIADIFGIFMILLVASGFYLWRRRPSI